MKSKEQRFDVIHQQILAAKQQDPVRLNRVRSASREITGKLRTAYRLEKTVALPAGVILGLDIVSSVHVIHDALPHVLLDALAKNQEGTTTVAILLLSILVLYDQLYTSDLRERRARLQRSLNELGFFGSKRYDRISVNDVLTQLQDPVYDDVPEYEEVSREIRMRLTDDGELEEILEEEHDVRRKRKRS